MANDGQKKSMVLKALDTVERVGNRLPDPAVIFLILTGIVILVSALCGFLELSVTYDFLDRTSGEITKTTVEAVSLLAPDSIRYMVTAVVPNFTGFFALGTVFTIMIGVGVADGTGFMSALLRRVASSTPKSLATAVVVFLGSCPTLPHPQAMWSWSRWARSCSRPLDVTRRPGWRQPLQVYPEAGAPIF